MFVRTNEQIVPNFQSTTLSEMGLSYSSTLSLCNKEVATAVHTRYMKGSAADLHHLLATYFLGCADPAGDGSWAGKHQMAVAELPYHLVCSNVAM
jgi:hypothetical protein